jgi:rod shape-determining protein MreD
MDRLPGIRPRPSLLRRLDAAARAAVPTGSTIILVLLSAAPLGVPGQAHLLSVVGCSLVWSWSLRRPAAMSPPSVFAIGVLSDLIGYQPIGVSTLGLLVLHGLAVRWRRPLLRMGSLAIWLAFAAVALGVIMLTWALSSLLTFRLLPVHEAVFTWLLSVAAYPAMSSLALVAHRRLSEPEGLGL